VVAIILKNERNHFKIILTCQCPFSVPGGLRFENPVTRGFIFETTQPRTKGRLYSGTGTRLRLLTMFLEINDCLLKDKSLEMGR